MGWFPPALPTFPSLFQWDGSLSQAQPQKQSSQELVIPIYSCSSPWCCSQLSLPELIFINFILWSLYCSSHVGQGRFCAQSPTLYKAKCHQNLFPANPKHPSDPSGFKTRILDEYLAVIYQSFIMPATSSKMSSPLASTWNLKAQLFHKQLSLLC